MQKIFCSTSGKGWFWFRVFGYGLHGKDLRQNSLLFSERYGYTKRLQIGKWFFKILKPDIHLKKTG